MPMDLPGWVLEVFNLSLALGYWRQLGLAFLLGSFAVATWSDLKHLSAQREFLEIWLAFLAGILTFDVYEAGVAGKIHWEVVAVKWGLIAVFSVLSLENVRLPYRFFRLAPADVAALATAASLLTPVLIVIFYLTAKLLSGVVRRLLQRGRPYYAFMPVVSLTTLAVLALGLVWQASVAANASAGR
ncbi:MAG TPA: hypothetical protein VG013_01450 [Gemmataceae bacterium]|jgi:hypothetical protein|nr:hypothetical protein [Gemmataceae bacterium]